MGMTERQYRRWQEEHSVSGWESPPAPAEGRATPSTRVTPRATQEVAPEETPLPPLPGVQESVNATELGGARQEPGDEYTIEYGPDMKPRRVPRRSATPPGPQSLQDLIEGSDAAGLVRAVRSDRLARAAHTETQTFGEIAGKTRLAREEEEQLAAERDARATEFAASVRFMVDTKTGEFVPYMPDEEVPSPGPSEILMSVGSDPNEPVIHAQGAKVTQKVLDNLRAPDVGITPTLRPSYQVPERYAHIAEALGIKT